MDMLIVDLDPIPAAGVGAPAPLWGEDGPAVDEGAQAAGTIGYELLCALAPRVPVTRAACPACFSPGAVAYGRCRPGVSGGQELLRNLQDSRRRMVSTWNTGRSSARF
ncbi:hypothetical protein G6F65_022518 [Rhizopus arrhizus]|nr:hypothetical protein G6F65_022518 [Rhizopus arrhizus]